MEKSELTPPSFAVDHRTLDAGIYLREVKELPNNVKLHIWDLRFVAPRDKKPLSSGVLHSIEHIFALKLREILKSYYVGFYVYGCKTGFALVTTSDMNLFGICSALISVIEGTIPIFSKDEIPCLTEEECGNPNLFAIKATNTALNNYLKILYKVYESVGCLSDEGRVQ